METIIKDTNFFFPGQIKLEQGLISDKYYFKNNTLLEIITDRIILEGNLLHNGIPYLGQFITSLGNQLIKQNDGLFKTNLTRNPEINFCFRSSLNENVKFYVGDYLNGLIWREYIAGRRLFGITELKDGMSLNDKLDKQIILLFTKDNFGNYRYRDIKDIQNSEIVKFNEGLFIFQKKLKEIFKTGKRAAKKAGYELAGTTYSFAQNGDTFLLNDFIHSINNSTYLKFEKDNNIIENLNIYEYFNGFIKTSERGSYLIKEPTINDLGVYFSKCRTLYKALTGTEFEPYVSKNLVSELLKKIHSILKENLQ